MEEGKPTVRIVGRYALYGSIAAGGMATVHFGRLLGPVGFSRTVAIKRLHPQYASDPEFVSMFLDEARLAARIRHPHVVPTLDVVATSGELFLVMDYVPGESLSRLIRSVRERNDRIPTNVAVAIMSGVLQGLHAAHEARNERGEPLGIVHRDVSPQNVLVGSDGQARVLDFGIAKAAGRIQTTREGQLKGKLAYMAPEQLRGEMLSRQTDIYAASVVLWEALTCERLFKAENEGAIVTKVLEGELTPPSKFMSSGGAKTIESSMFRALERLDAVVLRGLQRDPAKRYGTAREMALALERCIPPATAAEVNEWIEGVASPVLRQRAELVAEIESSSSSLSRPGQLMSSLRGLPSAERTLTSAESLISEPSMGPDAGHPPTQVSSISVASNAILPSAEARGRRRRSRLLVGAVCLALVPLAAFAMFRNRWVTAEAPAASSPLVTSTAPADLPAPPAPSASTAPTDQPAASASAPPAASSVAVAPAVKPSSTSTASQPRRRKPQSPAPTTTSSDCDPPFTWDSEGKKHYKPNCL